MLIDVRPFERADVECGEGELAGSHPDQDQAGTERRGAETVTDGPTDTDGVEHRGSRTTERCLDLLGEIAGHRVDGREPQLLHELAPRLGRLGDHDRSGVELQWWVDPKRRTVAVYRGATLVTLLGVDDELDGEDILPGFRLPIAEIFG